MKEEHALNQRHNLLQKDGHPVTTASPMKTLYQLDAGILEVLEGNTLLLIHQYTDGWVYHTPGWSSRETEEPEIETVVRGPRNGFVGRLGSIWRYYDVLLVILTLHLSVLVLEVVPKRS